MFDGVLQPFAGGGAETQAGGLIGSDGESAGTDRETSGAPQEETVDATRVWPGERAFRSLKAASSSESAQAKKFTHRTADGLPVQSFATLLSDLASRARVKTDQHGPTLQQVPPPTPLQAKAYDLLNLCQ